MYLSPMTHPFLGQDASLHRKFCVHEGENVVDNWLWEIAELIITHLITGFHFLCILLMLHVSISSAFYVILFLPLTKYTSVAYLNFHLLTGSGTFVISRQ